MSSSCFCRGVRRAVHAKNKHPNGHKIKSVAMPNGEDFSHYFIPIPYILYLPIALFLHYAWLFKAPPIHPSASMGAMQTKPPFLYPFLTNPHHLIHQFHAHHSYLFSNSTIKSISLPTFHLFYTFLYTPCTYPSNHAPMPTPLSDIFKPFLSNIA